MGNADPEAAGQQLVQHEALGAGQRPPPACHLGVLMLRRLAAQRQDALLQPAMQRQGGSSRIRLVLVEQ